MPVGVFVVFVVLEFEVVVMVWGELEDATTNEGFGCFSERKKYLYITILPKL